MSHDKVMRRNVHKMTSHSKINARKSVYEKLGPDPTLQPAVHIMIAYFVYQINMLLYGVPSNIKQFTKQNV